MLFLYAWAEPRTDAPTRHEWKRAPLLLGRGLVLNPEPADGPVAWASWLIPVIVGGIVMMVVTAFLLSRWFRAGDLRARAEFEAARVTNPFKE
jgi:hypothetical protein